MLDRSERSLARYLDELVAAGLVERRSGRRGRANRYRLRLPEPNLPLAPHTRTVVQVPTYLLFMHGLPDGAKLLYAALAYFTYRTPGSCDPGLATLMALLHRSRSSVMRGLRQLAATGLVANLRGFGGFPSRYAILYPSEDLPLGARTVVVSGVGRRKRSVSAAPSSVSRPRRSASPASPRVSELAD
jgi:predicted transcriptional regulator